MYYFKICMTVLQSPIPAKADVEIQFPFVVRSRCVRSYSISKYTLKFVAWSSWCVFSPSTYLGLRLDLSCFPIWWNKARHLERTILRFPKPPNGRNPWRCHACKSWYWWLRYRQWLFHATTKISAIKNGNKTSSASTHSLQTAFFPCLKTKVCFQIEAQQRLLLTIHSSFHNVLRIIQKVSFCNITFKCDHLADFPTLSNANQVWQRLISSWLICTFLLNPFVITFWP